MCSETRLDLEKDIAQTFNLHPDAALFRSLPGAGPALAPRLPSPLARGGTVFPAQPM